jgi:hypothetical protein
MFRLFCAAAAAFTVVVAGVFADTASASTPAPASVVRIVHATGTGVRAVRCASTSEINYLHGQPNSTRPLAGLAQPRTRKIWLNSRYTCRPLTAYASSGQLKYGTVEALVTVGHEASHLRSVRSESRAECLGVRFAYAWLRRTGAFERFDERQVRHILLDDSSRSARYRLNGMCSLPR